MKRLLILVILFSCVAPILNAAVPVDAAERLQRRERRAAAAALARLAPAIAEPVVNGEEPVGQDADSDCSICYAPLAGGLPLVSCRHDARHIFHNACIQNWFAQQHAARVCPLCRGDWQNPVVPQIGHVNQALIAAASAGDVGRVQALLLDQHINVNQTEGGDTALTRAARNGHIDVVRLLLADVRIDCAAPRGIGEEVLYGVLGLAFEGHADRDRARRAAPNRCDGLVSAAGNGHETVVRVMLADRRIDVNRPDAHGNYALVSAAGNGHETVVRLLLADQGIDVKQHVRKDMSLRDEVLFSAASNGHEAVVRLLLADARIVSNTPGFFSDYDDGDKAVYRALLGAAGNGHETVVRLLLGHRLAPGNFKNFLYNFKNKPMALAAGKGHEAVVHLLLADERIDADQLCEGLMSAAAHGRVEVVRLMLADERIDADQLCEGLMSAAAHGRVEVVRLMLADERIDADQLSEGLMSAAAHGQVHVVRLMLDHGGIDVNRCARDGDSALAKAALKGHVGVVTSLLAARGVNVNQPGSGGDTALMLAADTGQDEVVQVLLADHGIQMNSRNTAGNTPLMRALGIGDTYQETGGYHGHPRSYYYLLAGNRMQVNKDAEMLAIAHRRVAVVDRLLARNAEFTLSDLGRLLISTVVSSTVKYKMSAVYARRNALSVAAVMSAAIAAAAAAVAYGGTAQ
jgi:ankyrin repeat protein